ncbi:MAG: acyl-CoA reductase [Bacteroidota bacterium]
MNLKQICPSNSPAKTVEELLCFTDADFPLQYFDEKTVGFLNSLSLQILKHAELRSLPAFVALAYWLRKANIETLRNADQEDIGNKQVIIRQPVGVVFHVCPSNVDTIFLYSLAISLLAGNKNVLRVSNRMESHALDILFEIINQAIASEEAGIFQSYITVVAYGHDENINGYMSSHADARILWGGDKTVALFKAFSTSPRCRDIAFPDRLSFSIIKATSILQSGEVELKETCRLLYNDAFVFDQLGCSSPQVIFFLGDKETARQATQLIYDGLHAWAKEKYPGDTAALASLKLNQLTNDAINDTITGSKRDSNLLVFTQLKSLPTGETHSCGGGYFYVKDIESISELKGFISKKIQTAGYFGLEEDDLLALIKIGAGKGLDRIVPIGQALAFNNYWDGYHLLEQLTHLQYLQRQ